MALGAFSLKNFRNIVDAHLNFDPKLNFIYGENGSGKTSLLEAIYMLGMGRSFRTRLTRSIITHDQKNLLISGQISVNEHRSVRIAIEKTLADGAKIHIDREKNANTAQLIGLLPIQIINADSYCLLNAGPMHRRKFVDWGVFHVEHSFYPAWKRYHRALKQRNALLKKKITNPELDAWGQELVESGLIINNLRKSYLDLFEPVFNEAIRAFLGAYDFKLEYQSGWDSEKTLAEALASSKQRDLIYGSTQTGPHRADILFSHNKTPVSELLSRGQQKLFICALYIAQNRCLRKLSGKKTSYLIDDIGSELDQVNLTKLTQTLLGEESQLFITGIQPQDLRLLGKEGRQTKMFHVEHGQINIKQT